MTRPGGNSESDLLRRAEAGDETAFRALYQQFQRPIYRFALHMSGSAAIAEDVTQEVFMMLIEKKSRFDAARGSLRSYLLGTARNLLLRRFERDQRFVSLVDDPSAESVPEQFAVADRASVPAPAADLLRDENIMRVRRAVLSLPAEYREAVVLCELQELTYEEAAQALGCPIGTIRSRLHRARLLLTEKLREFSRPARRASATGAGEARSAT